MESESVTFGYLRRRDIEFTDEAILKFHVICNYGVKETYTIYFNFHGDVEEYHDLICEMIDDKIRNHPEMDYLRCTIKVGNNNVKYMEFDDDGRTINLCRLTGINRNVRGQCIKFINSILHH